MNPVEHVDLVTAEGLAVLEELLISEQTPSFEALREFKTGDLGGVELLAAEIGLPGHGCQ